jgi:hypothetical protein
MQLVEEDGVEAIALRETRIEIAGNSEVDHEEGTGAGVQYGS